MAEDHAAKLAEASEAPRLAALFAAGRLDGSHQDKLLALQACLARCREGGQLPSEALHISLCCAALKIHSSRQLSAFADGPTYACWLS